MTTAGGFLVSLEGCDGCGKSTQARLLCARLLADGYPVGPAASPSAVVREPGGTEVGEAIRSLLLHVPHEPAPWTEALLYAAARAELVARVLLPELSRGRILVLDRFIDSSLAYQGWARGLGFDDVLAVNAPALRGVLPDLTLVLEVDPGVCRQRLSGVPDRIEAEGTAFQRRVAEGFAEVARRAPQRVRVLDGERPAPEVAAAIAAAVLDGLAAAGLRPGRA